MIACTDPLDDDELGNSLPGPPFEMVDCPTCKGACYIGWEPCIDCYMQGAQLELAQGDPA